MEFHRIVQQTLYRSKQLSLEEHLLEIIHRNDKKGLFLFIALDQSHVRSESLDRLQTALRERTSCDMIIHDLVMECYTNERLWKLVRQIMDVFQ